MHSLAGAVLTAVNMLYAAMFGGPIDGTAWNVKVREDRFFHWTSQSDTLIFHGGRATIAGEVAKGYGPTLYDANEEDGATAFSLLLPGDEGRDPVEWFGRVEGRRINGVVIVRGRDGRDKRYVFTGEQKTG